MPLSSSRYGKGRVRVLRLVRTGGRHDVRELTVRVILEGDFARAYVQADNRAVIATDTIKNIVNVLAHRHPEADPETFATIVGRFLLDRYEQVDVADVHATETRWTRLVLDGASHDHAFTRDGNGRPFGHSVVGREGATVRSGIEDFTFMKTTDSGWSDFHSDKFRTLPDTTDRIVATSMDATWTWAEVPDSYEAANGRVMDAMLRAFAGRYSESVQASMYRMGEAALAAVPAIRQIRLLMPNKHYIPIDLGPFGITDRTTVFLPTDEPHGQIEAVVDRG